MPESDCQKDSACGFRIASLIGLVGVLLDPLIGLVISLPHFPLFRAFLSRLDHPLRRRRGVAFVLGGIEGPSVAQVRVARGLVLGRWRGAIRIVEWNRGWPLVRPLVNLSSRTRHERESDNLVAAIREHRATYPMTAICLIGQSGGCWIIVRALEKLATAGETVDAAVLTVPAISPRYDLSRAAAACATRIVSTHSRFDWVMLGVGTTVLGSADRRWGPAAGLVGWTHENSAKAVRALFWTPAWARLGHLGGHCTSAAPRLIARYIAPVFRAAALLASERAGHLRLFDRVEDDRTGRQSNLVVDGG